ncbi:Hsp33 family molecular chaperone HslO [Paenibacillus chartarius]|uniref:33 kDa chaperonin n=1 Tax=Paenibacillus chartarius TaxID=747481 RepID=A0ABV6DU44_9BACL
MGDYLIRGTALNGQVRAFAVVTTGITEEMRRRHDTSPVATAALGRTAAAALMMGAMLKGQEKLTIQIHGGGPIGKIVVDANANGEVRGYVDNPHVDLPPNAAGKLDVAGAVGVDGALVVTKDLGLKEPYRGSVQLISGELAEDFTYYFAYSEQTPSAVALGVLADRDVLVRVSGGFIIQLLPGLTDEEIGDIEQKLAAIPPVTKLLDGGATPEEILRQVLPDVQVLERMDIRFHCPCTKERIEQALISLGRTELQAILDEEGFAEAVCHYCNEPYRFESDDLKHLIEQIG